MLVGLAGAIGWVVAFLNGCAAEAAREQVAWRRGEARDLRASIEALKRRLEAAEDAAKTIDLRARRDVREAREDLAEARALRDDMQRRLAQATGAQS